MMKSGWERLFASLPVVALRYCANVFCCLMSLI